ncbi:hypothetical protein ACEPAG_8307 [Sanghuangporus baumii]
MAVFGMSSGNTQHDVDLDSTYGCLFLIGIFSTALWAISCLQLWLYIERYFQTDKMWLKFCTILLWILETVYLILVLKFLYVYFVKEFGNVDFLNNLDKDIYNSAPLSPVIVALVHSFYVMRAFSLSNNNYIVAGGLTLCTIVQLVAESVYIHLVHIRPLSKIIRFERVMNVITIITDTALSLAVVILLWRRHSAGFNKTEGLIKRLVAFTIGTGLITSVMTILALIAAEARANTFIYLIMDFCIS